MWSAVVRLIHLWQYVALRLFHLYLVWSTDCHNQLSWISFVAVIKGEDNDEDSGQGTRRNMIKHISYVNCVYLSSAIIKLLASSAQATVRPLIQTFRMTDTTLISHETPLDNT